MTHITLIASSFPIPAEDVVLTKEYLENLGMVVTVPGDLLGKDLLCANSDERRLSHLKEALTDSSVDIVWLLRGGYGLTRLVSELFSLQKPAKEKLFIGFSDATVLHLFLTQMWEWPSLHGPGANQLPRQKVGVKTIETTLRYVREGLASPYLPPLKPLNQHARCLSTLSGTVTGGNLCLLTCSLGTDWQINPADKILFLEDVDERGYRVDRMLAHLTQARTLDKVKAIIFGEFMGGQEADGSTLIPPVLQRFAENSPVPVFSLPVCGHGAENIPLPLGMNVNFSITS